MGPIFSKGELSVFEIQIKTGDRLNAGTDGKVQVRLHDDQANKSEPIVLENKFKDDFERGQVDTFSVAKDKVKDLDEHSVIDRLELWRDDKGLFSGWLVDTITVRIRSTDISYVFPMFKWIRGGVHYQVKHLDTSLPMFEEFPAQREREMADKKKLYQYEQKEEGFPVQAKKLPVDEEFSFSYKWDILSEKLKLTAKTSITNLLTPGEFESLEAMSKVYDDVFTPPKDFNGWKDDVFFGYQRVAGHNSIAIKLATKIPAKFPVTEEMVADTMEGISLKDGIAKKRLFIVDYDIMEGIPTKESVVICKPIGLFFVTDAGDLVPIAIQLFQTPGPENPIFTPKDSPLLWSLVKMWFNNADSSHHQGITHLGNTHLMMDGVVVATNRNLSQSHPIYKLLAPHFLYLLAINSEAINALLPEGGSLDTTLNAGSSGTKELTRRGTANWTFDGPGGSLPDDLKNRGLDDPKVLPKYHFREDAMDVYEAILNYVTKYVRYYYESQTLEIIPRDHEIQAWAKELTDDRPFGVGLKGLPVDGGEITSSDQLIRIVTMIIHTCSVSHAAANFPMYDQQCYPPNYPTLMRGAPPTSTDTVVTEDDILKAMPDRPSMLETLVVAKLLSTKGTNSLGDYEVNYIFDPEVAPFLEEFQTDLRDISARIKDRNEKRNHVYTYLDPGAVPNSISI